MSFPISYRKGVDTQVGKYFLAKEFDCPCDHCFETKIDPELVKLLDKLREKIGPLRIGPGRGYRCDRYQMNLKMRGFETAKGISTHQYGQAADVSSGKHTGEELAEAARAVGFRAVGVGHYFVHVDMRSDKDRAWRYRY